jgi:hypothetical protein
MTGLITILMCGDVMTGRGIDQVLPHPGNPLIQEPYMETAKGYVELAEEMNGPIPRPVEFSYVWGESLDEMERMDPDLRIINLETSVTKSDEYWRGKSVHSGQDRLLLSGKQPHSRLGVFGSHRDIGNIGQGGCEKRGSWREPQAGGESGSGRN